MTTDNLPAVREPAAIATTDTDSWTGVVSEVAKLAQYIAPTEFVPRALRDKPAAVAAAVLYGREVGLPPMTALNMTHVVEGRPGISAEGMRALVLAAGHELETLETTGAVCTMRGRRRGSETWSAPISWTLDMARAAGLAGKNNWKNHPRQMLQARTTTELCRLVFPDVIHGFRSLEELEDMSDADPSTDAGPAPVTTSRVGRRGAKKAAALPAPAERPAPAAGIPLPGEPGYTETSGAGDEPPRAAPLPAPEPDTADDGAPSDDRAPVATGDAGEDLKDPAPSSAEQEPAGGNAAEDAAPEETGDAGADARPASPRRASRPQERMIFAELKSKFGVDSSDREERLYLCGRVLQRELKSFDDLGHAEAKTLIDTFARLKDRAALDELLDTIDQAEADRAEAERQDLAGEPETGAES